MGLYVFALIYMYTMFLPICVLFSLNHSDILSTNFRSYYLNVYYLSIDRGILILSTCTIFLSICPLYYSIYANICILLLSMSVSSPYKWTSFSSQFPYHPSIYLWPPTIYCDIASAIYLRTSSLVLLCHAITDRNRKQPGAMAEFDVVSVLVGWA